ncbi:hypothetical protein [Streptomyces sp. VNUA24]|uniref:hypothetical protein n=1 Tax=Streptomyces sp. VNUA24 TaxID=3031131 RepID=UPI0023B7D548|nr:hypothetical protein [Streptomyces sp. VNUA24]WEH17664.1 hypothetical protein PYR72_29905 [Streptomyces sp. VNUA24]
MTGEGRAAAEGLGGPSPARCGRSSPRPTTAGSRRPTAPGPWPRARRWARTATTTTSARAARPPAEAVVVTGEGRAAAEGLGGPSPARCGRSSPRPTTAGSRRPTAPGPWPRARRWARTATTTTSARAARPPAEAVVVTGEGRAAAEGLAAAEAACLARDLVNRPAESFCRLPLLAHERRHPRSAVAERVNCSHRHGDTVQAALFLQDFTEVPYGGAGFAVRTLIEPLRALGG